MTADGRVVTRQPTARSSTASPAWRCSTIIAPRGLQLRRAAVHRGRGQGGARGVSDQHHRDRAAGRAIDGDPVGDGMPGPLTAELRADYLAHVADERVTRRRHRRMLRAPARDPLRLGQHAGRQLGDDPRRAQSCLMAAMGQPPWTLAGDARRACGSACATLSRALRRALGGGAADLSRPFPRDPSRAADAAAGRAATAATRSPATGIYLAVVSNKTGALLRREADASRLVALFRRHRRGRRRRMPTSRDRGAGRAGARSQRDRARARCLVCRRHRGRHGMRRRRRLRAGAAGRDRACRTSSLRFPPALRLPMHAALSRALSGACDLTVARPSSYRQFER